MGCFAISLHLPSSLLRLFSARNFAAGAESDGGPAAQLRAEQHDGGAAAVAVHLSAVHGRGGMNRWVDGIVGGWTFSGVFMTHSGFPLPFPNAAPLAARSAKLSDDQRDAAAQKAGRAQYDPSYD